jgi:hypothetical protein
MSLALSKYCIKHQKKRIKRSSHYLETKCGELKYNNVTDREETTIGAITKYFFPSVESRLAGNLKLSPNVTTIMSGHGNIRYYLRKK